MDAVATLEISIPADADSAPTALDKLRLEHNALKGVPRKLAALEFFDTEAPELATAWAKRDLSRIEALLRAGDRLTRQNWQAGIAMFNAGIDRVDEARDLLRQTLVRCEAELARFDIDYSDVKCARSKAIIGYAAPAARKHFFMEKVEYGRASGLFLSRLATGQLPWQAALAAGVVAGVWHLASRSKAFRQLKEMEGKLVLAAEAAKGDFSLFRTILRTRILPQFKGLLDTVHTLEKGVAALRRHSPEHPGARKRAYLLARLVLDSKQLLATQAGN